MTQTPETKKPVSTMKLRLTAILSGLLVSLLAFVAPVAAGPVLNGTILELLAAVLTLITPLTNLIIAIAPVLIAIAICTFIVTFINKVFRLN